MKIEKPILISQEEVSDFKKEKKVFSEIDAFSGAIEELFFINNPKYKKKDQEVSELFSNFIANTDIKPVFIYYPWKFLLVKTVPEDIYFELRTARNRYIIDNQEQQAYRNSRIGIAGLSVGSAVLSSIVSSGGCKRIKIADFDVAEITNLNRMRAKLTDIGENKTYIAAREVWELDPYSELELWDQGINKDTIDDFIKKPKVDVFIDEMDSLDLKISARFVCKEAGIPVLMATDNGDGIILDVERYDIDENQQIFNGLLGDVTPKDFENLDYKMWLQLATKIVGPFYLTERMQDSLSSIGKSIPSVPQLGTTANIAGAAISYSLRRILNNLDLPSGRYIVSLEEKILPGYMNETSIKNREDKTKLFIEKFKNR